MIDFLIWLAFIGLILVPAISASFWHGKSQHHGN
jgi:hypothetical protein